MTDLKKMNILSDAANTTEDLRSRMQTLHLKETFADVHFLLEDTKRNMKSTLPAHRNVLATGSPVFAKMCFPDDAKRTLVPLEIKIENVSLAAFGNILEYLYTDGVHLEDTEETLETLIAAKSYKIPVLEHRCEEVLKTAKVTIENVCSVLPKANSLKSIELKNSCMKFIQENTSQILRSTDFLNSPLSLLKTICKLQKLSLSSEVELFEAVLRWYNAKHDVPWNGEQARNALQPVLEHIRFLAFQTTEFGTLVRKYPGFFDKKEALDIMLYFTVPGEHNELPSWCNKGENRCFATGVSDCDTSDTSSQKSTDENREEQIDDGFKQVKIALMPSSTAPPPEWKHLVSRLEIVHCNKGKHRLTSIRCAFQDPGRENASMDLSIQLTVEPSKFRRNFRMSIQNLNSYDFVLDEKIFVGCDNTLIIQVKASNIENYRFMEFDYKKYVYESDSAGFSYAVGSNQKFFFIAEVNFLDLRFRSRNSKA